MVLDSGSQHWLLLGISWGVFRPKCLGPTPEQLGAGTQDSRGF